MTTKSVRLSVYLLSLAAAIIMSAIVTDLIYENRLLEQENALLKQMNSNEDFLLAQVDSAYADMQRSLNVQRDIYHRMLDEKDKKIAENEAKYYQVVNAFNKTLKSDWDLITSLSNRGFEGTATTSSGKPIAKDKIPNRIKYLEAKLEKNKQLTQKTKAVGVLLEESIAGKEKIVEKIDEKRDKDFVVKLFKDLEKAWGNSDVKREDIIPQEHELAAMLKTHPGLLNTKTFPWNDHDYFKHSLAPRYGLKAIEQVLAPEEQFKKSLDEFIENEVVSKNGNKQARALAEIFNIYWHNPELHQKINKEIKNRNNDRLNYVWFEKDRNNVYKIGLVKEYLDIDLNKENNIKTGERPITIN